MLHNNPLEGPGHDTIIGTTGSGKTYAIIRLLASLDYPVLFFNTKMDNQDMPGAFMQANGNNTFGTLERALHHNAKINFIPSVDPDKRDMQLRNIIRFLFGSGFSEKKPFYLAVDEVHLFEKDTLKSLVQVATTGRSFGFRGIYISQRPALIDNTLMSLSSKMIIFKCNMEGDYFRRYRIPYSELIEPELIKKGPFSFCLYDFANVTAYSAVK